VVDWVGAISESGKPRTFEFSILPMRSDAPVYLELGQKLQYAANGQVATLSGMRLVPEYELMLCDGGACSPETTTLGIEATANTVAEPATKD
jgi:hypothetical protein